MYKSCFCLNKNYLELISNEKSTVDWAKCVLLPYINIGSSQQKVTKIECIYNTYKEPEGDYIGDVSLYLGSVGKKYQNRFSIDIKSDRDVLYRIMDENITIYYPKLSEETMKEPARFCREILYNMMPDTWTEIHASAVACNGRAIAFVGEKGSGKTTLLSILLSSLIDYTKSPFDFVTNDRLWIKENEEGCSVYGSPMPVLVGYGTMTKVPELNCYLNMYQDGFYILNNLSCIKNHEYTTVEFTKMFSKSVCTNAKLVAIIFLSPKIRSLPRVIEKDEIGLFDKMLSRTSGHANYPNCFQKGHNGQERPFKLSLKNLSLYEMGVCFDNDYLLNVKKRLIEMFADIFGGDI